MTDPHLEDPMPTTDPLALAMRDALAVLTACHDDADSFAVARDTVLTTIRDRSPHDHEAALVQLLQGLAAVSSLLVAELALTTGVADHDVLQRLGAALAAA